MLAPSLRAAVPRARRAQRVSYSGGRTSRSSGTSSKLRISSLASASALSLMAALLESRRLQAWRRLASVIVYKRCAAGLLLLLRRPLAQRVERVLDVLFGIERLVGVDDVP